MAAPGVSRLRNAARRRRPDHHDVDRRDTAESRLPSLQLTRASASNARRVERMRRTAAAVRPTTRSISSSELVRPRLKRAPSRAASAVRPNACNTCDGSPAPAAQADTHAAREGRRVRRVLLRLVAHLARELEHARVAERLGRVRRQSDAAVHEHRRARLPDPPAQAPRNQCQDGAARCTSPLLLHGSHHG